MDTIFDLRDISYSYVGKIHALKDISLKAEHGERCINCYVSYLFFTNALLTLASIASCSSLVIAWMILPWMSVVPP